MFQGHLLAPVHFQSQHLQKHVYISQQTKRSNLGTCLTKQIRNLFHLNFCTYKNILTFSTTLISVSWLCMFHQPKTNFTKKQSMIQWYKTNFDWKAKLHHSWNITFFIWFMELYFLIEFCFVLIECEKSLTHWGREKMAAILLTTFLNTFSSMEIFEFWLKFHWNLFLRVQSTISQHWFK